MREKAKVREVEEAIATVSETRGVFEYTFLNNPSFSWLYEYVGDMDSIVTAENGDLFMLPKYWVDSTPTVEQMGFISKNLTAVITEHEYELKKLINTLGLDYNPIYNVQEDTTETYRGDGTNDIKRKESGGGSSTDNTQSENNIKLSFGNTSETTNTNYGERVDNGTQADNNQYGNTAGYSSVSHNVSPMDSDIFHSNTQDIENHNEDGHSDTLNRTTSTTTGSHTDNSTHKMDAREDTTTEKGSNVTSSSYSNNANSDTNGVTTSSFTRHVLREGNIGVTSSQDLIKQEREIARFSIYKRIMDIFINSMCLGVYVDTDSVAGDIYKGGVPW